MLLSVAEVFVSTLNCFYGNENDPNLRKHDVPVILDEKILNLFRKSDSSTVFILSSCVTVISESPLRSSSLSEASSCQLGESNHQHRILLPIITTIFCFFTAPNSDPVCPCSEVINCFDAAFDVAF
jgi:hypothetical protein